LTVHPGRRSLTKIDCPTRVRMAHRKGAARVGGAGDSTAPFLNRKQISPHGRANCIRKSCQEKKGQQVPRGGLGAGAFHPRENSPSATRHSGDAACRCPVSCCPSYPAQTLHCSRALRHRLHRRKDVLIIRMLLINEREGESAQSSLVLARNPLDKRPHGFHRAVLGVLDNALLELRQIVHGSPASPALYGAVGALDCTATHDVALGACLQRARPACQARAPPALPRQPQHHPRSAHARTHTPPA